MHAQVYFGITPSRSDHSNVVRLMDGPLPIERTYASHGTVTGGTVYVGHTGKVICQCEGPCMAGRSALWRRETGPLKGASPDFLGRTGVTLQLVSQ